LPLTERKRDGIKNIVLAHRFLEALAVFGHGCNKKKISMAAWQSIIFLVRAGLAI